MIDVHRICPLIVMKIIILVLITNMYAKSNIYHEKVINLRIKDQLRKYKLIYILFKLIKFKLIGIACLVVWYLASGAQGPRINTRLGHSRLG